MEKKNKHNFWRKLLLLGSVIVTVGVIAPAAVQAADSIASRSYGVDVSGYQASDLTTDAKNGAQFAIVKVSEGTSYQNPKAASQIASAKANNMLPMAYHFADFSSNSSTATREANYAVQSAKKFGLPSGSYLACDWEAGTYNSVTGAKSANTSAIMAFLKVVKQSGYKPLLYSGAYLLRNSIDTSTVLATYPNSLWVASYASSGRIDTADFNYFPSMDGVIIWQFTDNWRGLNVDGNITLLPLSYNDPSSQAPSASNTSSSSSSSSNSSSSSTSSSSSSSADNNNSPVTTTKRIMYKSVVYTKDGHSTGQYKSAYTNVTVIGGAVDINGKSYYQIGDNQYVRVSNVDGVSRTLTHNAYIYTNKLAKKGKNRKGTSIPTFGKSVKLINGKRYYRIGKNRYIRTYNFR